MALPKGFEPLAYRLGGGRSIRAELREHSMDYSTHFQFIFQFQTFFGFLEHILAKENFDFMKFSKFCLLLLSLPLFFSCSHESVKKSLPIDNDYNDVIQGKLNLHDDDISQYGKNVLPIGFHGSYPDSGIYEIGGKAGDESGKTCPAFDFSISNPNGTAVLVTLTFEEDPMQFPSSDHTQLLGFEVSYQENNQEIYINGLQEVNRLSEMFEPSIQNYELAKNIPTGFNFFIYHPQNALGLSIKMYPNRKLNFVRFHYAKNPIHVTNASIFLQKGSIDDSVNMKYDGSDVSRLDYTKKLGSHYEFNLISQYGKVYSKDYLLSQFIYKDEYDNTNEHVTTIEDEDDYFLLADKAPLGSKFDVKITAKDSSDNLSDILLHFTIADKCPPYIAKKKNEDISISYTVNLDEEFINSYFLVRDNYDEQVSLSIKDMNNQDIDTHQTGLIKAKIIAIDSFNNKKEFPFSLERYDDQAPMITCSQEELILSPTQVMKSETLLSFFSATDEIDGDLDVSIVENTYSENSTKVGNYIFKVNVKDSSNNEAEKTLNIYVKDEEGPIFFAKGSFMTFAQGMIPEEKEIIESLIRQEVIPDKNYISSELVAGEEITNDLEIGEHEVTMQYFADDDTFEMVDLTIQVVDVKELGIQDITPEEEKNWWAKFCQWWIDLWNLIVSFFQSFLDF